MKTAVSIPDEAFEAAEKLAKTLGKSRSRLYREALAEYIARHDPESVTRAMNEVWDEVGQGVDPFTQAVGRQILERSEGV